MRVHALFFPSSIAMPFSLKISYAAWKVLVLACRHLYNVYGMKGHVALLFITTT